MASPAAAASAIAAPIRTLKRFRTAFMPFVPAWPLPERPDRREVLPGDDVVEDEGHEEDEREDERSRRDHAARAVPGEHRRAAARVSRRSGLRPRHVILRAHVLEARRLDPLAEEHRPHRDEEVNAA